MRRLRVAIPLKVLLVVALGWSAQACDDDDFFFEPEEVERLLAVIGDTVPVIGDTLPEDGTVELGEDERLFVAITPLDDDDDAVANETITATSSNTSDVTVQSLGRSGSISNFRLERVGDDTATITFRHADSGTTYELTVTVAVGSEAGARLARMEVRRARAAAVRAGSPAPLARRAAQPPRRG